MSVTMDHPLVASYLARLEAAAMSLPLARRTELVEEIGGHVRDALSATGGDEASIRAVLDRVGDPVDIVAAERENSWGAADPVPAMVNPQAPTPASPWGGVEIAAVVCLTLGNIVVPILMPIIGLVLAWGSTRWRKREKWVATVLGVLPLILVALAFAGLLTLRTSVNGPTSAPVESVIIGATPQP